VRGGRSRDSGITMGWLPGARIPNWSGLWWRYTGLNTRAYRVALRSFLQAWAWLSVPVATESQVGTRHVVTVDPPQRHAGKRGCRHKEAQGTMVGRPVVVDVLQDLHGMSSGLCPDSVQVKDQHNGDLRVIMRPDRYAGVSPLPASTLARNPPCGLGRYRSIGA
jgi:hypothetical protein